LTIEDLLAAFDEASGLSLSQPPTDVVALFRNGDAALDGDEAFKDVAIVKVERDDGDKSIDLVTFDQDPGSGLSFDELREAVAALVADCAGYRVFIRGDYQEVEKGFWSWLDSPAIAWTVNDGSTTLMLVRHFDGYEQLMDSGLA
jgi:hypothetical protein